MNDELLTNANETDIPFEEEVIDEELVVEISGDELEAKARLLPPEGGGAELTLEDARRRLAAFGVTYGIDEKAFATLIEKREYDKTRTVAAGIKSEDGVDGKVIFHFSTDERTGRPREIGGGRVDYRALDLYEPVTEGQLLATRELATPGMPGMSVKGKELKQKPGKEAAFPRGKNVTVNAEKTEMRSNYAGMVQLQNNSVNVSNVYNIKGDCDLSVGNIDFDGSVHVTGGVRSGNSIKATGSVVIGGVVEAATIIAGGSVEIKSGMQGADKGKIIAGGSVTALYIERSTVQADGAITVDVSIHSNLESGASITASGKRGAIIGGRVGAAGNVVVNYLGAVSNTRTEISVGMMMRTRERITSLEKEIEKANAELVKLKQLEVYLERAKGTMDPTQWETLQKSGEQTKLSCKDNLEAFTAEIETLQHELEHATDGKVHVFNTAFAGSRISIGSSIYKVSDEISYATFKFREGEVVYDVCEISK